MYHLLIKKTTTHTHTHTKMIIILLNVFSLLFSSVKIQGKLNSNYVYVLKRVMGLVAVAVIQKEQ